MNILELDSYQLVDPVQFNDKLNPRLFDGKKLRPDIRDQLLVIAQDFQSFLGVTGLNLKDITISGSNAAYSYTSGSDLDLHLVVDLPEADRSEVFRELFDAKKYQYNDQYEITIKGIPVELYVQNANVKQVSQGIYSVLNDEWVSMPKQQAPAANDISVQSRVETAMARSESAIRSRDKGAIDALLTKLHAMRRAGLEQGGEYSPENLAYKTLRANNVIDRLYRARNQAKSKKLSLESSKTPAEYGWVVDAVAEEQSPTNSAAPKETTTAISPRQLAAQFRNQIAAKYPGVTADLFAATHGGLHLSKIEIPKNQRRLGTATEILKGIVALADRYQLVVSLSPTNEFGTPKTVLIEFYKRFGFVFNRGKNKNYRVSEAMYREPRTLAECAGRITPQNQTADVGPNEIKTQAAKFGNVVDRDGYPARTMTDRVPRATEPRSLATAADLREHCVAGNRYLSENYTQEKLISSTAAIYPIRDFPVYDANGVVDGMASVERHLLLSEGAESDLDINLVNFLKSLASLSKPVIGKRHITVLLSVIGNQLHLNNPVELTTFEQSAIEDGVKVVLLRPANGPSFKFPRLYLRSKSFWAPFLFRSTNSYNQFRTALSLKTSISLPDIASLSKPSSFEVNTPLREAGEGAEVNSSRLSVPVQRMLRRARVKFPYAKTDTEAFLSLMNKNVKDVRQQVQDVDRENQVQQQEIDQLDSETNNLEHEVEIDLRREIEQLERDKQALAAKNQQQDTAIQILNTHRRREVDTLTAEITKLWKAFKKQPVTEAVEDLYEVNMSPGVLRQWANSSAAQGIRLGFEAELVFPGYGAGGDEYEDWRDTRVESIEQIASMFPDDYHDQYNLDKALRALEDEYDSYVTEVRVSQSDEYAAEAWVEHRFQNDWEEFRDEWIRNEASDDGLSEEEIDELLDNTHSREYRNYRISAREEFDRTVQDEIDSGDGEYGRFVQQYQANVDVDSFEDWALNEGYDTIGDFMRYFRLDYPEIPEGAGQSYSEAEASRLATDLGKLTGEDYVVLSGYHTADKDVNKWYIENDGSIEVPDDMQHAMPVEIVSPALPLDQALDAMSVFFNATRRMGAISNRSTGFHMSLSIDQGPLANKRPNYLKLVLFTGDEYVLDQFSRASNKYAMSAGKQLARVDPLDTAKAAQIIEMFRKGLTDLAANAFVQANATRYSAVNMKDNYVEFRAAGGANYSNDVNKLIQTAYRYAYAYAIAVDENAYRNEFAKKLYKFISDFRLPVHADTVQLFANYAVDKNVAALKQGLAMYRGRRHQPDVQRLVRLLFDTAINTLTTYTDNWRSRGTWRPVDDEVLRPILAQWQAASATEVSVAAQTIIRDLNSLVNSQALEQQTMRILRDEIFDEFGAAAREQGLMQQ